jgi:glutathione S-transferase
MKLFFSRNPNPRLAVAVARYLDADVEFEYASPFAPGQAERYRPLNPNLSLPILTGSGKSLWEADAIACRLSRDAQSDFWRSGDDQPEMIRWLSWGKENFARACDMVHFERGTKQRYRLGPIDHGRIEEGLSRFRTAAAILEAELSEGGWLVGSSVSYADFRMAAFLPFNDVAGLPLEDYPSVGRWYRRLEAIDAWRDPFEGLDAPELPPVPGHATSA